MGHSVSGSDLRDSAGLERLRAGGVRVAIGHDAANVGDAELVAISTAIPPSNPEVVAARAGGIPVLRRAEILTAVASTRATIAVAGTHGKTTTSSMLALELVEADRHPSFIIGGELNEIGSGAVWDTGELFVVEADESDGTFLALGARHVLVTNIEPDHLEHYGGWEPLRAAFEQFVRAAPGVRVLCADDDESAALSARLRADGVDVLTYGTAEDATHRMVEVTAGRDGVSFSLLAPTGRIDDVHVPLPGLHNARNAAGALTLSLALGVDETAARAALNRFAGVARRFEHRGEVAGVTFVDDYAHLPSEVAAAIAAARDGAWRRIVCAFQPHRYSRTETLWPTFADAFCGVDVLALTDVYASGEAPRPGVTGKLVVNAVLDAHPWARVAYLPHRADLLGYLSSVLRPGDLCLTLGAGDLTSLPDELQARLREHAR
jgi:UDP-N-acetylmuramate--alanine ligase